MALVTACVMLLLIEAKVKDEDVTQLIGCLCCMSIPWVWWHTILTQHLGGGNGKLTSTPSCATWLVKS